MECRIKLLGKQNLLDREISINDSDGVVQKSKFELPDNWYGGSVKEFRRIKDSNFLMVMDRKDRIINIAYVEDELSDDEKRLIGFAVDEVADEVLKDNEVAVDVVAEEVPKLGKKK